MSYENTSSLVKHVCSALGAHCFNNLMIHKVFIYAC